MAATSYVQIILGLDFEYMVGAVMGMHLIKSFTIFITEYVRRGD